ncbi:MAG: hypothetical protein ACPG31_10125 [Planctomycetota bacterium]
MTSRLILTLAALFAICLWVLWPGSVTQGEDPQGTPTLDAAEVVQPAILAREELASEQEGEMEPHSGKPTAGEPQDLQAASLEACLKQEDPVQCILRLDGGLYSIEEIAAILNDPEIAEALRVLFLQQMLVTRHPMEVANMLVELEGYLHGDYWTRFAWFEQVFRRLGKADAVWSEGFLQSMTAQDLFREDGSPLMLNIVNFLPNWPSSFSQQMKEGGLGAWGGEPDQIDLAFFLYLDRQVRIDSDSSFDYLTASLDSAHYPDAEALQIAQSSLYLLRKLTPSENIDAVRIDQYLHDLLDHDGFGHLAALQFLSDTDGRVFPGIGQERTDALRQKAERVCAEVD